MLIIAEKLRLILSQAKEDENVTHVIIVCDEFEKSDFEVRVPKSQSVRARVADFESMKSHRVVEVYSLGRDIEEQLREPLAYHLD